MAKKIITIGKKGVTERIEGSGPVTDVNVDYPSTPSNPEAGKPIKDRLSVGPITDKGGPFSLFDARIVTLNGNSIETATGFFENGKGCLFLNDYPKMISSKSSYNSGGGSDGIYVENNKISDSRFIQNIENANMTIKHYFSDIYDGFGIVSGGEEFGEIAEFTSSNGLKFWGYPFSFRAYEYGYRNNASGSGGTLLEPSSFTVSANSGQQGNGHGLSSMLVVFGQPITSIAAAIIPESEMTQELLENPITTYDWFGNEIVTYVCGVYATGSS